MRGALRSVIVAKIVIFVTIGYFARVIVSECMNRFAKVITAAVLLLLIGAAVWFVAVRINAGADGGSAYTPSPEFTPAYEAITGGEMPEQSAYDIEQTVRIMNSLEIAQSQSESFTDFLEYMARQDYRGVAPEVLEVKKQLFPVIERMNELQQSIDELSSVWTCIREAAAVTSQNVVMSDIVALASGNVSTIVKGVNSAFSGYMQQPAMKRKTEKEFEKLRREYIAYIEEYTPVYRKYMEEWDKLCLEKDKAYINLYSGSLTDALTAARNVLAIHPQNREGLLLKAIALIRLGAAENGTSALLPEDMAEENGQNITDMPEIESGILMNKCYAAARRCIDTYINLYPDRAAPALLLDGIICEQTGRTEQALALYEQASSEYPRQAEALTDLLDSYINRTYLNQSVEGRYLLNYYRSTMEGAGIFSPNFRKAALYARLGRGDESREEIYKHFFRRGSQSVQDCLLSDMQYCENFLGESFGQMLLESSYMDIRYSKSAVIMGIGKKKGKLDVELVNRTDIRFENVRVFLCLHTVGMYKDDYDVVRIPQFRNVVGPYETVSFNEVDINGDIDDISRIRAIVMTDDKICWVDAREFKTQSALSFVRRGIETAVDAAGEGGGEIIRSISMPATEKLESELAERTKFTYEKRWTGGGTLIVRVPRILALLAPYFSLNPVGEGEASAVEDRIAGDSIEIKFAVSDMSKVSDLYIYSKTVSFKVGIVEKNGSYEVGSVSRL